MVDAAGDPFPVVLSEARITVDGVEDVRPVGIDPSGDFAILLDGDPGLPGPVRDAYRLQAASSSMATFRARS